jgi:hypothetical protein
LICCLGVKGGGMEGGVQFIQVLGGGRWAGKKYFAVTLRNVTFALWSA